MMTYRMARVGRRAPPFSLPATTLKGRTTLDEYDGKWLVLFFYPGDFTLLCPVEITQLHDRFDDFAAVGASVLGVSTDPLETHRQWIEASRSAGGLGGSLAFPLASDKDGEISRAYGVLLEPQHVALRGLFLIDPNGILQFSAVHGLTVGRSVDEILRTIAALQCGGMCPPDWVPGDNAIGVHSAIEPGRRYERFDVLDLLGEGGMGSVFRARDIQLQREVALKVFRSGVLSEPEARARFLREARTAASVCHPHICTIHQIDDGPSGMLMVMELIEGEDLSTRMARGPVAPRKLVSVGIQIARALSAIHERGLVHRDVKPANIRIEPSGRAVLLDFGLARATANSNPEAEKAMELTTPGTLVGTVRYMSPEQIEGKPVGPASDIFSLGTTFYFASTGSHPFAAPNFESTVMLILKGPPPPAKSIKPSIPQTVSDLVARMLARDPEQRPTAEEVVRSLQRSTGSLESTVIVKS